MSRNIPDFSNLSKPYVIQESHYCQRVAFKEMEPLLPNPELVSLLAASLVCGAQRTLPQMIRMVSDALLLFHNLVGLPCSLG